MNKLLRFEWRKLYQQKSLYLCFGIGLVMIFLLVLLAKVMTAIFPDAFVANILLVAVLPNSGFVSLLAIYLAIFVGQDFAQQTLKNVYARGYSRSAVYFTKYLVSLAVTIVMAILYLVFSLLCGLMFGGKLDALNADQWASLAMQLWVLVGLHGLYFGISMAIGKIGGSVALNLFGVTFVFSIVQLLLQIGKVDFDLLSYNLENLLTALNGEPLTTELWLKSGILPAVYAVVFVGLGYWVNYRREI